MIDDELSEKEIDVKRNTAYIKSAFLQDYKSIHQTKANFESGLNIIIGKNGSGKSNFTKFLNNSLNFDFSSLGRGSSKIELVNFLDEKIEVSTQEVQERELKENQSIDTSKTFVIREDDQILLTSSIEKDIIEQLNKKYIKYVNILINHGLPENLDIMANPLYFSVNDHLILKIGDKTLPYFIRSFLFRLVNPLYNKKIYNNAKESWVREIITSNFDYFIINQIKPYLLNMTMITDIRLNNFNIVIDQENDNCLINNLFMEFQVDDKWYVFNNLSDGTQRLFYLISEIAIPANHHFSKSSYSWHNNECSKIVFLEEPELGVHPHQLFKLMQFIKEQSKNMQIILTTHSPKSLDVLSIDDLDRILICSMTKTGTKLKRITKEQRKHAVNYIKTTGFLSDYWFHSDLES